MNVPTKKELTDAITSLVLQRSQARDLMDQIDKQLPVLQGQLQLLNMLESESE